MSATVKIIDLYCRISRDYDGDGGFRSVDSQEDDGLSVVAGRRGDGWQAGLVFKDPALSAWNPKVVRPQWEELMSRLESGQSHGVWVYDLSRFTRKPMEGERLIVLAERGVIVASSDSTYDLTTADGKKQFRDAMTAAAFESDKTSQRTRRGKRKKALRGKSNASWRGFGLPGYGPKPDGWEPGDPREMVSLEQVAAERDVVRELAVRLLAGEPMNVLTKDLLRRDVRTASGHVWTSSGLRQMFKRPSLAGLVEYHDQVVAEVADCGEPVLDRETWEAVQSMFAARRRGRLPTRYLLSGLIRCGLCGTPLMGRPRTSKAPYPDGEINRQYWCQLRAHGVGCGRLAIDQRYADVAVEQAVLDRLSDPAYAETLTQRATQAAAERSRLLAAIATAETTGRELADRLGRGEMDLDRYDAATRPLDERLGRLRAELADVDGPGAPSAPAADAGRRWMDAERLKDLRTLRRMVHEAFPDLVIRPATSRGRGGLTPDRFDWEGDTLASRAPTSRRPR